MNTIQEQWDVFSKLVIPVDAPSVQRTEMRRAFYAGAEAMMRIQWLVSDASVSEEAGIQILEGCRKEMDAFAQQVANGKA